MEVESAVGTRQCLSIREWATLVLAWIGLDLGDNTSEQSVGFSILGWICNSEGNYCGSGQGQSSIY